MSPIAFGTLLSATQEEALLRPICALDETPHSILPLKLAGIAHRFVRMGAFSHSLSARQKSVDRHTFVVRYGALAESLPLPVIRKIPRPVIGTRPRGVGWCGHEPIFCDLALG